MHFSAVDDEQTQTGRLWAHGDAGGLVGGVLPVAIRGLICVLVFVFVSVCLCLYLCVCVLCNCI